MYRNTDYTEEDKEADDIYESIQNRMSERRREKKEKLEIERIELLDREHMDVKRQFEDLKVYYTWLYVLYFNKPVERLGSHYDGRME